MNQVIITGTVKDIKATDAGIAFTTTTGFGDYTQDIPCFFAKGNKSDSPEAKKVAALQKYMEEGGELMFNGSLASGKKGLYMNCRNFFVGKFKPYNADQQASSSSGGGADSDDLPF